MWQFFSAGGPFMVLLLIASVVGVTFIVERGLALRWSRVVPTPVEQAIDQCKSERQIDSLKQVCQLHPSPIARLILVAIERLHWPKAENRDAIQTRARHEITQLERGLVVLEIIVGIGPLLGLVGTIHGLITLFGDLGRVGIGDQPASLATGISIALNTTLMGLLVAIPSLIAWSYYSKKVETMAVEMESLCDEFLQRFYRFDQGKR